MSDDVTPGKLPTPLGKTTVARDWSTRHSVRNIHDGTSVWLYGYD